MTEDEKFIALNNASTEDYDRQELDRVIASVGEGQDDHGPDAWIGVSLTWGDAARLAAEVERLRVVAKRGPAAADDEALTIDEELAALRSDLEDALSAEVQWVGEVGSDEHIAITGDVMRAREALVGLGLRVAGTR